MNDEIQEKKPVPVRYFSVGDQLYCEDDEMQLWLFRDREDTADKIYMSHWAKMPTIGNAWGIVDTKNGQTKNVIRRH